MRCYDAIAFAVYSGSVDWEVTAIARRVVSRWENLVEKFESTTAEPERDLSGGELIARRLQIATEDIAETADDSLRLITQIKFTKKSATDCIGMVDQMIARWRAVQQAIKTDDARHQGGAS